MERSLMARDCAGENSSVFFDPVTTKMRYRNIVLLGDYGDTHGPQKRHWTLADKIAAKKEALQ